MPIDVFGPGTPIIGPGVELILHTSLTGPIPSDWEWVVYVRPHGDEDHNACVLFAPIWSVDQHEVQIVVTPESATHFGSHYSRLASVQSGDLVDVTAELQNASGVVQDSGTVTSWHWATNGSSSLRDASTSSGGLTEEQAEQLAAAANNTQLSVANVGAPGGSTLVSLASLFTSIPPHFTNRHGSIVISGQGAIARGTEPFRDDALGFEWHWHTIPDEFGRDLGSVDELEDRIVQWRLIGEDTSAQLFQVDVLDSNYDGVRHIWGVILPATLEWYVRPGAEVELSFLVPAFG